MEVKVTGTATMHAIYDFGHLEPCVEQSQASVDKYISLVGEVIDCSKDSVNFLFGSDLDLISKAREMLELDSDQLRWYAAFGCAVLLEKKVAYFDVWVIGLDDWELVYKTSDNFSSFQYAKSNGHLVFYCGKLNHQGIYSFHNLFAEKLSYAEKNKKNDSKIQRTPAFIQSITCSTLKVVAEALKTGNEVKVDENQPMPRGGTTDVGMHTGSKPRSTAWPLVFALFRHRLPDSISGRFLLLLHEFMLEVFIFNIEQGWLR